MPSLAKIERGAFVGILLIMSACGSSDDGSSSQPPPIGPTPPPPATPTITTQRVFPQLFFPSAVAMIQAPGDASRWFVVQQPGTVWVFNNDPAVATASTFIDISSRVNSTTGEAGLLGMAFHPDFANNGQAFLSYTRTSAPLESVISRFFSVDGGLTLTVTVEDTIMTVLQDFVNHNGGGVAFGPDGNLYAGFGDGGSGGDPLNRAQSTTNLLGSFIRINVDGNAPYEIPAGNPFAANQPCTQGFGGADCPEIFAWGTRNPWRWSFDRQTGDLWAGDVGQNQIEEVDLIQAGQNYGWREREGANCFDPNPGCSTDFVDPITEYDHGLGQSVTGGFVYRGSQIPDLFGYYVFGDFVSGRIFTVPANSPIGTEAEELLDTSFSISTFAEDVNGELYLLDYSTGYIHQIVDML